MPVPHRPRRLLLAIALPFLAVALAACSNAQYPNSIFHPHTEFNRDVGKLFRLIIALGAVVFVFVEALLLYTIFRYRRRSESDRPEHVHGNTTLEILWTAIPAVILAIIAVPTVSTIFKTQAVASADALQVQVIGHQWWWEFRYPQYTSTGANGKVDTLTTANELYLPLGRKVNFALTTQDVLHSFWIPQLGGKRDLITNRVNHLWFTPDSIGEAALNGFCAEYCGTSHGNMHFKAFTVTKENFDSWVAHQLTPAAFGAVAIAPPQNNVTGVAPRAGAAAIPATTAKADTGKPVQDPGAARTPAGGSKIASTTTNTQGGAVAAANAATPGHDMAAMQPPVQQAGFVAFPHDKIPLHVTPTMPLPTGLAYNESLQGDAERGRAFLQSAGGGCMACHIIKGNPMMIGQVGPNLTHIGTRSTIAGGLFPNDTKHLARWIKNARMMKPGVIMPTLGKGQFDPVTKQTLTAGLTDEQIADIVAYLQALK